MSQMWITPDWSPTKSSAWLGCRQAQVTDPSASGMHLLADVHVPYLGCGVFSSSKHPLPILLEAKCCHIFADAFKVDDRILTQRFEVVHADVLVSCCCQLLTVWSDLHGIDLLWRR
ncbi:hypothetical protein E2C01_020709 [Portunus trituberculatus]|uniref:Uncharacterized protein n=1 Tax=Portunus trituberculatus TaxID=210409 RepID=A0A5B7E1A8_PORTR|nr:hypothetical protein [Portunus trituberculatus]